MGAVSSSVELRDDELQAEQAHAVLRLLAVEYTQENDEAPMFPMTIF